MIPAIVAIIVGLALGGLLVASSRRDATLGRRAQADDLAARKESLYAQVRELDDTRDRLDPALYQAERARLLDEAARVLREIDAPRPPEAAPAPAASGGFLSRHPQLVGALWGGLVGGFAFAIYSAVSDQAAPRAEGQSMTGGQAASMSAPSDDPALAALAAAVEANPADLEAKNRYGHALINADRVREAWKLADAVTEIDPGNAEARTHQAVTLMEIGDFDMAGAVLDRVLAGHPSFAEALGYRGAIYARAGDKENAVAMWTRARAAEPSQAAVFDELIARVDSLAAPPAPAGAPTPAPAESPADADVEFAGEVRAPAGTDGSTGVLFVSVRPAGVESGPPARASRLGAPSFPSPFSLGAANAPMGGSISGPVVITAKLDLDGNPTTQEPGNLVGRSAPVELGATGIVIELGPP